MNDIGAHSDMNSTRNVSFASSKQKADFRSLTHFFFKQCPNSSAKANAFICPPAGCKCEEICGFARHSKLTIIQHRANIFARFSFQGQFHIMDRSRPIHCNRLDYPLLNPINQIRCAAGFNHMPTDGCHHGITIRSGPYQMISHPANAFASKLIG